MDIELHLVLLFAMTLFNLIVSVGVLMIVSRRKDPVGVVRAPSEGGEAFPETPNRWDVPTDEVLAMEQRETLHIRPPNGTEFAAGFLLEDELEAEEELANG